MKRISVPKQYGPLFDDNASEIVASSGRSSGKNTNVEIYAIREMMKSKYNNVWYCRAEYSDIGDKCFSSMISTIQLMGLENAFSWKVSPYRITCEVSGAKCYFDGINGRTDDDLTATKGFTPQFKTLAAAILDEADQVKHPNHMQFLVSIFFGGIDGQSFVRGTINDKLRLRCGFIARFCGENWIYGENQKMGEETV